MNSKEIVDNFISQKTIAVIGVSRTKSKFGNVIYRELKQKGYKVYPINPNMNVIEGDTCYPDLFTLPEKVGGVIINIPPDQTEKVLREVKTSGITKVWLQQGSQSEAAEKFCKENGIDCVSNECVLMFIQPSAFIHRAHKWIWGVLGKLPA